LSGFDNSLFPRGHKQNNAASSEQRTGSPGSPVGQITSAFEAF
jgi:hypothetical protein